MKIPMSSQQIQPIAATSPVDPGSLFVREELPLTVRQAAIYLGVSVQTVYLWVERRQIPPLRVMGEASVSCERISCWTIHASTSVPKPKCLPTTHDQRPSFYYSSLTIPRPLRYL